jgi:hypothetical protein
MPRRKSRGVDWVVVVRRTGACRHEPERDLVHDAAKMVTTGAVSRCAEDPLFILYT